LSAKEGAFAEESLTQEGASAGKVQLKRRASAGVLKITHLKIW